MKTKKMIIGVIVSAIILIIAGLVMLRDEQQESVSTSRVRGGVENSKEDVEIFTNEEYGFEFHYPKTLILPDGKDKDIIINEVDLSKKALKESILFRINSYTLLFSANVEKKPKDFTDLRSYVESVYQRIDEIIERERFHPVLHREFQPIEIANRHAILVTSFNRQVESTIFIEKDPYLYVMHNSCFYVIYNNEENSPTFSDQGSYNQYLKDACHGMKLTLIQHIVDSFTFK